MRLSNGPTPVPGANPLRPALKALLPPLALYRRVLRAHRRHLPREMRLLGDEYVKREFRAHKAVENPAQVVSFGGTPRRRPLDGREFESAERLCADGKLVDYVLDGVAALRAESRGKCVEGG